MNFAYFCTQIDENRSQKGDGTSEIRQKQTTIKNKHSISAWLLLSVFVPMLLLSSLHVHEERHVGSGCAECVNHIPHQGHITLDNFHLDDCVLCQFVSMSYLVVAAVFLAVISSALGDSSRFTLNSSLAEAVPQHRSSRAPPCCI